MDYNMGKLNGDESTKMVFNINIRLKIQLRIRDSLIVLLQATAVIKINKQLKNL